MKSTFLGFYSTPTESVANMWLDDSTLFVFDTNCLLNLYRCEDHTREDILKVMDAIAPRTWIPFQVGFEYQRNRRSVIEDSIKSLDKIKDELESIYTKEILSSGSVKKHLYSSLNKELSDLQSKIKKPIEEYINKKITPRIENKKKISKHDIIRDRIDIITSNRVGEVPTQEQIDKINALGEKRYENKIPPGFKDAPKKSKSFFTNIEFQDKFGDLYLWREIIEKAKSDKIKNVIFICDDNKEDWWFAHAGKTHGALESLKTEICNEANIQNFQLINQLTFLHEAKNHLKDIEISESSLKEVEELSFNTNVINEYEITDNKINDIIKEWNKHYELEKLNKSILKKRNENIRWLKHNRFYAKEVSEGSTILVNTKKITSETYGLLDKWDNLQNKLIDKLGNEEYYFIKNEISKELSIVNDLVSILEDLIHTTSHFSDERLEKLISVNKEIKESVDTLDSFLRIAISYVNLVS